MGDTCVPMADSCQSMAKPQQCKVISLQLKFFKNWKKKKGKKNGGNNLKQLLEGNISKNFFLEYRCVE